MAGWGSGNLGGPGSLLADRRTHRTSKAGSPVSPSIFTFLPEARGKGFLARKASGRPLASRLVAVSGCATGLCTRELVGRAAGAGSPTLLTLWPVPPLSCLLSPLGKNDSQPACSPLISSHASSALDTVTGTHTPVQAAGQGLPTIANHSRTIYPMSRQIRYLDARPPP